MSTVCWERQSAQNFISLQGPWPCDWRATFTGKIFAPKSLCSGSTIHHLHIANDNGISGGSSRFTLHPRAHPPSPPLVGCAATEQVPPLHHVLRQRLGSRFVSCLSFPIRYYRRFSRVTICPKPGNCPRSACRPPHPSNTLHLPHFFFIQPIPRTTIPNPHSLPNPTHGSNTSCGHLSPLSSRAECDRNLRCHATPCFLISIGLRRGIRKRSRCTRVYSCRRSLLNCPLTHQCQGIARHPPRRTRVEPPPTIDHHRELDGCPSYDPIFEPISKRNFEIRTQRNWKYRRSCGWFWNEHEPPASLPATRVRSAARGMLTSCNRFAGNTHEPAGARGTGINTRKFSLLVCKGTRTRPRAIRLFHE